ncbi:MAG: helix-turn-helix domain-containing protein [Waterburya sp.]
MVKIEIAETTTELEKLLRLTEFVEVRERIQVIYWIKSDPIKTVTAISLLLGKHETTIFRWLNIYRTQGLKALLNKGKSSGRNKKITPFIEQSLKKKLQDPEQFHSYKEAHLWLKKEHGIEISYTAVYQLIRYRLKEKLNISVTAPKINTQEINKI